MPRAIPKDDLYPMLVQCIEALLKTTHKDKFNRYEIAGMFSELFQEEAIKLINESVGTKMHCLPQFLSGMSGINQLKLGNGNEARDHFLKLSN